MVDVSAREVDLAGERTARRACPVCGGCAVEHLHHQRFVVPEGYPLPGGYDVAHCIGCGFVYADMAARQREYDTFYALHSKYEDGTTSTGSGESEADRQRLDETSEILSRYVPKNARVLDIGSARGGLLAALQRRGYGSLAGIDPSAVCVEATRQRAGCAYQGWLTKLPREAGTFDCIVLSHVLEHVVEVSAAVSNLLPLLREAGLLFIEVPDAERYADHVCAPFQDFNTEHINHFSRRSLENLMARHGLGMLAGGERFLRQSGHMSVYGIFRRMANPRPLAPDAELKPAILRYIDRSERLLRQIDAAIRGWIREHSSLMVWGTGQLTLKLLAETSLADARIVGFIDSSPVHQGKRLHGLPILAPTEAANYEQPILIATLLHQREIEAQIRGMGLRNEMLLLPEAAEKAMEAHG